MEEVNLSIKPIDAAFPVCTAFNRFSVKWAGDMAIIITGLEDNDGYLLSSFSICLSPQSFPDNFKSLLTYTDNLRKRVKQFTPKHNVLIPKGGITIPHARYLNAGLADNEAEIRFEDISLWETTTKSQVKLSNKESASINLRPVAILRSSLENHFGLLSQIYLDNPTALKHENKTKQTR